MHIGRHADATYGILSQLKFPISLENSYFFAKNRIFHFYFRAKFRTKSSFQGRKWNLFISNQNFGKFNFSNFNFRKFWLNARIWSLDTIFIWNIPIYKLLICPKNIIHIECVKLNLGGTSFDFIFKPNLDYYLISNFFEIEKTAFFKHFRSKNPYFFSKNRKTHQHFRFKHPWFRWDFLEIKFFEAIFVTKTSGSKIVVFDRNSIYRFHGYTEKSRFCPYKNLMKWLVLRAIKYMVQTLTDCIKPSWTGQ